MTVLILAAGTITCDTLVRDQIEAQILGWTTENKTPSEYNDRLEKY